MFAKWAVVIVSFAIAWRWMSPKTQLTKDKLLEKYDYVIVGAGSAGAILAARLSEDPDVTVALLEAGPDDDEFPEAAIPLLFAQLQKKDIDWAYMTEPQKHACFSHENQRAAYPRGRALGGTSLINAQTALRGSRHDYDRWAAMGNDGWSYEDVLPYFKKIERVTDKKFLDSGYRGTDGPVQVTETKGFPEAGRVFIEAAQTQGFEVGDLNTGEMSNKAMVNQVNVGTDGRKQSTALTYLKPAMSRDNLHVLTNAHVTKVLFEGKRAVGVQYVHRGQLNPVHSRNEVILSAGVIGSPQILLLSGVGPREHLEDMKIPVVADLPVGKNLQDHVHVQPAMVTMEKPAAIVPQCLGLLDKLQYKFFGTGVFSYGGAIGNAFARSKHQPHKCSNPYLQYMLAAAMPNAKFVTENLNMKQEVADALYGGLDGRDGLSLMVILLQPASVGYIRLKSTNPFDHPLINPEFLAEDVDLDILLDGIHAARKIMSSDPLVKKLGAKLVNRIHPYCANETYDSDQYWKCFIRQNALSLNHPTSTCRMGPYGDTNSVVDTRLRVHGLECLRVVDASVMPLISSGNTNFPTMMIAERAADIIKGKI